MSRFPYIKSFRIYTEKPSEEVYAVLKGGTTVWGMGHFPLGEGAFVGEVGASDFICMGVFIAWIYVRIEFCFEARRARENMEELLGGETVDT